MHRKGQAKKVVCIPAPVAAPSTSAPTASGRPANGSEVVPSDLWAWRKYGQKPIKGSPYPRYVHVHDHHLSSLDISYIHTQRHMKY